MWLVIAINCRGDSFEEQIEYSAVIVNTILSNKNLLRVKSQWKKYTKLAKLQ